MGARSSAAVVAVAGLLLAGCVGGDGKSAAAPGPSGKPMLMTVVPPSASPSASASSKPKPMPSVRVGSTVSAASYAGAFCQAILDDRLVTAKLRKALAPQASGDGLESMRDFYNSRLDGVRSAALDIANHLRRAGSPRIDAGKELASDVRAAMDYVDLVDAARDKLDQIVADDPMSFDKSARRIVQKLQNDVAERRTDIQKAPDSAAFDDAVDASATCKRL